MQVFVNDKYKIYKYNFLDFSIYILYTINY